MTKQEHEAATARCSRFGEIESDVVRLEKALADMADPKGYSKLEVGRVGFSCFSTVEGKWMRETVEGLLRSRLLALRCEQEAL